MNTSISIYHRPYLLGFLLILILPTLKAQLQPDSSSIYNDSTETLLNMDATYHRPFLSINKMPVVLGGYLEANSLYSSTDGISEGLSFQARRLTVFMAASIINRIKFLSEIEFEDGAKEIGIEFAALDIAFHPLLNLRGGIIMNPIGAFNQNHDGPKWEFVERPDVAVNLLPTTWSNAGFGLYGKTYTGSWILGYEAYLTNGFDNQIINNGNNKTFLPATKPNEDRFEENNSGKALVNGKFAIKNRNWGEIGFSYMGGVYNKFQDDGLTVDRKRRVDVFAIDLNTTIQKSGTYIVGEIVYTWIQVPSSYTQQFGNRQWGLFVDVVQPVFKKSILDWENARFNIAARFDFVDWNIGTFSETDSNIGDALWAFTPALSFRPSSQTVFRLNYRYQWQVDILKKPAVKTASWLFGFSTYF